MVFEPDPDAPGTQIIINSVAAGAYHSLAISTNESVFCWGLSNFGQVGLSEIDRFKIDIPLRVSAFKRIKVSHVTDGNSCSFAVTSGDALYTWGSIMNHTLNDNIIQSMLNEFPVRVRFLMGSRVIAVSAAQEEDEEETSGQVHVLVITDNGQVHGCLEGLVLYSEEWAQYPDFTCRQKVLESRSASVRAFCCGRPHHIH